MIHEAKIELSPKYAKQANFPIIFLKIRTLFIFAYL